MKKRYLYSILAGVPGFFIALLITFVAFAGVAGFLWIYIFGDSPWPDYSENILGGVFIITFLGLWITAIIAGFITGKKLEATPGLDRNHIIISVAATVLPVLLITLQQLGTGNIGAKSDSQLCSEFCAENGYSASAMPPRDLGDRTCSCLDGEGQEAKKVPLNSVFPAKQN